LPAYKFKKKKKGVYYLMLRRIVCFVDSIDLCKIVPYSGVFQFQELIKPLSNFTYVLLLHICSFEAYP